MTDAAVTRFATLVLPEALGVARDAIAPPERRGPDHQARYDHGTLFYDAVHCAADRIVRLFCPPLLNLAPILRAGVLRLDGARVGMGRRRRFRRYEIVEIAAPARPARLTFHWRGWSAGAPVSSDADCAAFAGRNCLFTLSRDNPLRWLRDWAHFHVAEHGADAALIFDNGSTAYGPEAIRDTLAGVAGLDVVRVASIDRPYGPLLLRGARGREMFLQSALLNVARRRFLWEARAVLQCDVDELVVSETRRSVFDATAASRAGFVKFRGVWRAPEDAACAAPRHADHVGVIEGAAPCPAKYCVTPAGRMRGHSWNVHNLDRVLWSRRFESEDFHYIHCRGITTRWKGETSRVGIATPRIDPDVRAALDRVFGAGEA